MARPPSLASRTRDCSEAIHRQRRALTGDERRGVVRIAGAVLTADTGLLHGPVCGQPRAVRQRRDQALRPGRHALGGPLHMWAFHVCPRRLCGADASRILLTGGPPGATRRPPLSAERARSTMLGCVTVFGLLLGGICGCGLCLGFLLHWLVPAIDRGMATLCGLVATGVALLAFGQLMTLTEPSEAEEEAPPVWRLRPLPRPARATRRPRKRP